MVNKLNCGLPGWFSWIGSSFWGFWKDWFSPYIPPNPSSSDLVAYPSPNEWDIKFLFPHIRNNKFQTLIKKFNLQLKKLQYIYEMDNGLEKKKNLTQFSDLGSGPSGPRPCSAYSQVGLTYLWSSWIWFQTLSVVAEVLKAKLVDTFELIWLRYSCQWLFGWYPTIA